MLVGKIRIAEHRTNRKGFVVLFEQKILHINDPDNIVRCIFIYGKPSEHILTEDIKNFLIGRIDLYECHIDTCYHDFFGFGITEVEEIMDHVSFFVFNDSCFLTDIYDGTKFFFGHLLGTVLWVDAKQEEKSHRQFVNDEYDRSQYFHQYINNAGNR